MKVEELLEEIIALQEKRVTMPPVTAIVAKQIKYLKAMKNKQAVLESTNETISDILCPFCNSEIAVDYTFATEDRLYIEYHCKSDNCELNTPHCIRDAILFKESLE